MREDFGYQEGDQTAASRRRYGSLAARWSISILAALMAAGCSAASVLNGLVWRHGLEITRSIPYGDGPRRTVDVYRRKNALASPVVVFFYGGSWQGGDKEMYLFVAAALARRGFVTLVPDYRVYPEVRYPGFIEDGALAVQWAKKNAARFGGDPDRLFVMGHSAGAYIAAMLAIDDRWLRAVDLEPRRDIAGLIGLSGPYDFLPLKDETLKVIFGGADRPETQPISHVAGGEPPALLATGTADQTVEPGNTNRLAKLLRAAGNDAKVVTYPGVSHLGMIGAFARPLRFLAPVLDDVASFIATTASARSLRQASHEKMLP
jgi:acetyl esterase/lipase